MGTNHREAVMMTGAVTDNPFRERNVATTVGMVALIAGGLGVRRARFAGPFVRTELKPCWSPPVNRHEINAD